jgi:hypothetical protein
MLLYDTNSLDAENTEALIGARKSVALIRDLPALVRHTSQLGRLVSRISFHVRRPEAVDQ